MKTQRDTSWMLRPLTERVFMRWRVRFEFSIVREGRLCHEETPALEVLSMHGYDVKGIALRVLCESGQIPAGARLENWHAALVDPRAVYGRAAVKDKFALVDEIADLDQLGGEIKKEAA